METSSKALGTIAAIDGKWQTGIFPPVSSNMAWLPGLVMTKNSLRHRKWHRNS